MDDLITAMFKKPLTKEQEKRVTLLVGCYRGSQVIVLKNKVIGIKISKRCYDGLIEDGVIGEDQ